MQAVQQRRGHPGRETGAGAAPPARDPPPTLDPFERQCLRSALAHPSRAREMAEALEVSVTQETALVRILRWIARRAEESGLPEGSGGLPESEEAGAAAILSQAVHELPEAGELTALSLAEGAPPEDPEAILLKIEQLRLNRRMDALKSEVRRAQETGNLEELKRFQTEQYQLAQERRRLTASLTAGVRRAPADSEEKRTGQVREDFA